MTRCTSGSLTIWSRLLRPTDPVTPFWFEFERTREIDAVGLTRGCGVSGYTLDDALSIVQAVVFMNEKMPAPVRIVENIRLQDLDQGHVAPNMYPMLWRGVWYPLHFGGDRRPMSRPLNDPER